MQPHVEKGEGTVHWVAAIAASAFCTIPSSQALTDDDPPVEVMHRTVSAFPTYKENKNHLRGVLRAVQSAAELKTFGKHIEVEAADFMPHHKGGFENIPNTVNEASIVDVDVTIQEVIRFFVGQKCGHSPMYDFDWWVVIGKSLGGWYCAKCGCR